MTTFRYSAVDGAGRGVAGTVEAPSRQAAISSLLERKVYVTTVAEAEAEGDAGPSRGQTRATSSGSSAGVEGTITAWLRSASWKGIGLRGVTGLFRQLATALEAGLPLLTALRVVREQSESAAMGELVDDLARRVEAGDAFSDALAAHRGVFTPLHVSMARAGETAGVLDEVMGSLADFAERDLETRERIRSASVYPAMVLALAVLSVGVIVAFILPRIMETIGDNPDLLPLPTRILMGISDGLRAWWWLGLIGIGLGVWGFRRWTATAEGRLTFDSWKLRVPILGKTLRLIAVGRFARALGTLSKSGIQIVEALVVLRDTLGNEAMGQAIDRVQAGVTQGQPIAEPLRESGQFPPMFIQVVSLGEKTGRLDQLLLRAADSFDKDTTTSIQRTMTALPALFIVLLALLVTFILAAVLLPIISMQTGMGV